MKALKTLIAIALSAGGLGTAVTLGAVANKENENKAQMVEADNTVAVYLDTAECGKFNQSGTINCHYWGGSSASTWPGIAMTKNDKNVYTASIPSDTEKLSFNLNGYNGDCQTVDLTFDSSKTLWTIWTKNDNGSSQNAYCTEYQKTIYVLDRNNLPLCETQKIHVWHTERTTAGKTTWPGDDMTKVGGSNSHIYSYTTLGNFDRVIFNNGSGSKTGDLTVDGECCVLMSDWNGTKWVSLEAAQFIDGYMHFYDIGEDNTGSTANCSSNYQSAKTAYNALSSNDVRSEVLGVSGVSARLSAWATANGGTLNNNGSALSSASFLPFATSDNNGVIIIITIVTISILATAGSFFLIRRKRKEQ